MGCNRYAHDTGAMSQTSDDMHSQTGPRVYVEEYAKMRHSNSRTLPLNFEHLMHHDDVLQKVISGQFLRYPCPYWDDLPFWGQFQKLFCYSIRFISSATSISMGSYFSWNVAINCYCKDTVRLLLTLIFLWKNPWILFRLGPLCGH